MNLQKNGLNFETKNRIPLLSHPICNGWLAAVAFSRNGCLESLIFFRDSSWIFPARDLKSTSRVRSLDQRVYQGHLQAALSIFKSGVSEKPLGYEGCRFESFPIYLQLIVKAWYFSGEHARSVQLRPQRPLHPITHRLAAGPHHPHQQPQRTCKWCPATTYLSPFGLH